MLIFRFGKVSETIESRMFCATLASALSDMPILEKLVLQFTDDVRVLWVIAWGLYIEVRLLRS